MTVMSHHLPQARHGTFHIGRCLLISCLAFVPCPASAQPSPPRQTQAAPRWNPTPIVRNLTRVEMWRFFEPAPPAGGDPDYATIANRLFAGFRQGGSRYEITGGIQYVQFGWLPERSIGPGPLGTGATYFQHNGRTDSRGVYLKSLNVQVRNVLPGVDVRAGRMPYTSGAEAASGDPGIEGLKRMRLDSRLVGEFEWSLYQRAFDGVRVDWDDRRRLHATFAALWPTQGGFEEKAGRSLRDVRVLGGGLSVRPSDALRHTELQGFVLRYDDTRPVQGRPDNTGRAAARADVQLMTAGASLAGVYPVAAGRIDVLAWVALQQGDWYDDDHGAYAVVLEAGHQWQALPGRPWLRAGWNRASGDDDGLDGEHGTFFPMLPTGRKYSLSATYAPMNLDDVFAQVIVRPHAALSLRADVHHLSLVEPADQWYAGSGATRRHGTIFGYAGRRSSGATALARAIEGSADWTINRRWSVNGYVGWLRGGDVVRVNFAGDRLTFAYVENVVAF